ncbi:MAG: hypothetical protein JW955_23955 [Sedimentisphaerales bacterium]|nr:hypothetical protein [Sedimentisphaerales bacterium]
MAKDPVGDGLGRNGGKTTKPSNYDLRANAANARRQQKGRGRRVVSFARGRGGKGKT